MSVSTSSSIVLDAKKHLITRNDILTPPGIDQAQLAVISTGLCGSDLHYYQDFHNGDFHVRHPLVLGHESSGIITALGPSSSSSRSHKHNHLRIGQRVAIEAGIYCQTCSHCKSGRYNLCHDMRFCSSAKTWPHLDGMLRERLNHPSYLLFPLPDNVSYAQGALAEPLSVLIHAAYRASLPLPPLSSSPIYPNTLTAKYAHAIPASAWPHSRPPRILVLGAGPIGLLACLIARTAIEFVKEQIKLRGNDVDVDEEVVGKEKSAGYSHKNKHGVISLKENYSSPRTRSDSDSTSTSSSSSSNVSSAPVHSGTSPSLSFSSPTMSMSSGDSEVSPPSSVPTTPTTLPSSLLDNIVEAAEELGVSVGVGIGMGTHSNKERDEERDEDVDVDEGLVAAIDINEARLSFALENGFVDRVYKSPVPVPVPVSAPTALTTNTNTTSTTTTTTTTTFSNTPTPTTSVPLPHANANANANANTTPSAQESSKAALEALNEPDGFDIVFECSGAKSCIEMGVYLAATGGKVVLVGMGTREVTIATSNLQGREVDVVGCFRYANTYPGALGLLSGANTERGANSNLDNTDELDKLDIEEGVDESVYVKSKLDSFPSITATTTATTQMTQKNENENENKNRKKATLADVETLITHRFALDDTARAFELMDRGVDGEGRVVLKVVVDGPGVVNVVNVGGGGSDNDNVSGEVL